MPRRNNSFAVSSLEISWVFDFADAGGTSPDGATAGETDERVPLTLLSVRVIEPLFVNPFATVKCA